MWTGPLGLWRGPHSVRVYPEVGSLGSEVSYLGFFRFTAGLSGYWSRPLRENVVVDDALQERDVVDSASPQPDVALSGQLRWHSTQAAIAPLAHITNQQSIGRWQDALVVATVWLTLGGSVLAALLIDLVRRERARSVTSPAAIEPERSHGRMSVGRPMFWFVVVVAALLHRRQGKNRR